MPRFLDLYDEDAAPQEVTQPRGTGRPPAYDELSRGAGLSQLLGPAGAGQGIGDGGGGGGGGGGEEGGPDWLGFIGSLLLGPEFAESRRKGRQLQAARGADARDFAENKRRFELQMGFEREQYESAERDRIRDDDRLLAKSQADIQRDIESGNLEHLNYSLNRGVAGAKRAAEGRKELREKEKIEYEKEQDRIKRLEDRRDKLTQRGLALATLGQGSRRINLSEEQLAEQVKQTTAAQETSKTAIQVQAEEKFIGRVKARMASTEDLADKLNALGINARSLMAKASAEGVPADFPVGQLGDVADHFPAEKLAPLLNALVGAYAKDTRMIGLVGEERTREIVDQLMRPYSRNLKINPDGTFAAGKKDDRGPGEKLIATIAEKHAKAKYGSISPGLTAVETKKIEGRGRKLELGGDIGTVFLGGSVKDSEYITGTDFASSIKSMVQPGAALGIVNKRGMFSLKKLSDAELMSAIRNAMEMKVARGEEPASVLKDGAFWRDPKVLNAAFAYAAGTQAMAGGSGPLFNRYDQTRVKAHRKAIEEGSR